VTLEIWGRSSSINVQKALWWRDEIGRESERIDAGRHRDADAVSRAEMRSIAAIRVLDRRLADRPFLAGDAFTRHPGGSDGASLVQSRHRTSGDAERHALVRPDARKAKLSSDRPNSLKLNALVVLRRKFN